MNRKSFIKAAAVAAFCVASLSAGAALAQQRSFDNVKIKVIKLADNFYELEGAGGNIGLSVGDDGPMLIDDQFAPLTDKIKAAIATITKKPVRLLVNTHHHPDHTGGNAQWGDMGALIIAQKNVRDHLIAAKQPMPALPVISLGEAATFHWNGDEVSVHHIPHAHTDGDIVLFFHKANVIHTGDVWRTVSYPRVDVKGGGSMKGIIDGLEYLAAIGGPDTKYLPGHGVVSSRDDIIKVANMMKDIWNHVAAAKKAGMSSGEAQAVGITAPYDAKWATKALPGTLIVQQIYNELP